MLLHILIDFDKELSHKLCALSLYCMTDYTHSLSGSSIDNIHGMQELILDHYVKAEALHLDFLAHNQKKICAELYCGLADVVHAGDTDARKLGTSKILPSSHTGPAT